MDHSTPSDGERQHDKLERARAVYAVIFKALQQSIAQLEAGSDTSSDARARQDLYRAHVKQLQAVFEIEGSLEAFNRGNHASRIDLDAARAEISQRIRLLRDRRGD